jgi:nitric oxide reductase NorD protein
MRIESFCVPDDVTTQLDILRVVDATAFTQIAGILPSLALRLGDSSELAGLVSLCKDLAVEVPGAASILVGRLEYLSDLLDPKALRRWVLTGVRLYPDDMAKLGAYLRLEDPTAIRIAHIESGGASFGDVRLMLQYYLTGFGLKDVELQPIRQHQLNAPPMRSVLSDNVLRLPEHYLTLDGAGQGDIYRAAAAHAYAHLRYSMRHRPVGKRKPVLVAIRSLVEDARVERLLALEYPGLHELWGRFHVASGEAGDLSLGSLAARLARALHDPHYSDPNHWVNKGRELFEAASGQLDDIPAFDEIGSILANDLGQMRVRFDLQQYRVEPGYRDDNSLLWEFEQDNEDMPPDEALSRNSAQVEFDNKQDDTLTHISPMPPAPENRVFYPEWDWRTEVLRDHWVTLLDAPASGSEHHSENGYLRRKHPRSVVFENAATSFDRAVRLRRQAEGEELDLDAAIDARVCQRSRVAPDPRIFKRPGRRRRDVSVLLLLDLSESTNDRIPGTFTSILDIEKRAAEIVAGSIDKNHCRIALHGFASNGRHDVRYVRIKEFDQPFGIQEQKRLAQQHGSLSTRIGAALRHAGSCFHTEHSDKKIILLITDGEPSDIDVYDRNYLVHDARHAVGTLRAKGINTFCITLDKHADTYVRSIFGAWNYAIVDMADSLPAQLTRALAKVAER